jgi:hypothetical protein
MQRPQIQGSLVDTVRLSAEVSARPAKLRGGTSLEFSGGVRGEYWGYALGTLGFFAGLCAGVRIPSTLKNVWIKYVET